MAWAREQVVPFTVVSKDRSGHLGTSSAAELRSLHFDHERGFGPFQSSVALPFGASSTIDETQVKPLP